jgi:hypothetical protein
VSVVTGRHVIDRQLRLVHVDAPHFAERLGDDGDLRGTLDDLRRIRRDRHHPRETIRHALHGRRPQRFTALDGFVFGSAPRLVWLGVLRFQDDRRRWRWIQFWIGTATATIRGPRARQVRRRLRVCMTGQQNKEYE